MKALKNAPFGLYIAIIITIALLLRLFGIWHDYPYSFYPDEAHFVKRSLAFGSGDLNPHWFHKPAFFMYVLFIEYGVFFIIGKVIALWSSVEDFAVSFIANPGPFYIVGRVTVTLFSLGSILVSYVLCKRHFNRRTGLFAALLLALCYGDIAASQYVKADIPASFFTILSVYFLLNYLETHSLKQLAYSVIAAGAGTATKFYPYAMLMPIFLSVLYIHGYPLDHIKNNWQKMIAIGCGVIVLFYATFFVCSPYNFLDPIGFKSTFGKIIALLNTATDLFTETSNKAEHDFINAPLTRGAAFLAYFQTLLRIEGMGPLIGIISVSGFIYLLFARSFKVYILLLFPSLFIFISTFVFPGYAEPRHQLPVYAFFAIAGAVLIDYLCTRFGQQRVTYILLALLIYPLALVVERGLYVSKTDTRNIAKHWIEQNIPAGSKIVLDEYGPILHMGEQQLRNEIISAEQADKQGQFTAHYAKYLNYQLLATRKVDATYTISEIRFPWWREKEPQDGIYVITSIDRDMGNPLRPLGVKSLEQYKNDGVEYIIVSSERYRPFFDKTTHRYRYFPRFRKFYTNLFLHGKLVREFSPADGNRPGPTIRIYKP